MNEKLINKPLIEAIFELRWELPITNGVQIDENYNFLIGLYYDKIKDIFPFKNTLPSIHAPLEAIPYIVQYQFRKDKNSWPLIQLGPGILTLNDTENYNWKGNFENNCVNAVNLFVQSYPDHNQFSVSELKLRYLNAIEFDFEKENILEYLEKKLKLQIKYPEMLFEDKNIQNNPYSFHNFFAFPVTNPRGAITFQFSRGQKNGKDAIIWDISFISKGADIRSIPENFDKWLSDAHAVIEKCFFTFVEGDLLRSFKNV